jgi:hypothetical protein
VTCRPRPDTARHRSLACRRCLRKYCTADNAWVCGSCADDAIVEAVADITTTLLRQTSTLTTCPLDGCLLRVGEVCPACQSRAAARTGSARPPVARSTAPAGWIRRGAILIQRKAAA